MRRWLLTAACAMLFAPVAVEAQRPLSIGLGGGATIPTGDLRTNANTGWNALGTVALGSLMQPIGLRLDVAYNRFGGRGIPAAGASGNLSVGSATLNASYRLPMTDSPLSPYVISGLGAYRTDCSGALACGATTRYGWNVGLGTKLNLLGAQTFLEARYHRTKRSGSTVQFFPITVGLML
ncbi:MAG: outer membrane beta-barrel protein [Gemmatimonadaceae bacterium]|nr:outer membrane beta-barrel protein [Gemmatimonadaceae bacterium]NUO95188.1 outer membrane beta-barrel protein [Gemmatimonadaceae bacterium]NUP55887.1 outer membrane beta-barrel protein [Gemmatimonadaceae bacterium]NUR34681.1 outer membrane beta-barrel protein [Gemmatimonadaceae bacterium]NUS32149.1 outer membrane beta-barrel protein [Gemmatimonadaceae bacterium]